MDKLQAQNIIKQAFENPFDKGRFVNFIRNLLNRIEDAPFIYRGNYIPDAYKPYVSVYERIGKYNDGEKRIGGLYNPQHEALNNSFVFFTSRV